MNSWWAVAWKNLMISALLIGAASASAQSHQKYVVELESIPPIAELKGPDHFFDLEAIGAAALRKDGSELRAIDHLFDEIGVISARKLIRRLPDDMTHLTLRSGERVDITQYQRTLVLETYGSLTKSRIGRLKNNSIVRSLHPVPVIKAQSWPPNDPLLNLQPQLHSSGFNIGLPQAYGYTSGNSGIKVAVIDDAVDFRHEDLGGGIGEGFRVRGGWDFADDDWDPSPDFGFENHGTPVAGIIGALGNNGLGGIGVAGGYQGQANSGVQLFAFRTSNEEGLIDTSLMVEAVLEAATEPSANNGFGYGVHVINLSLGSDHDNYLDLGSLYYGTYLPIFRFAERNQVVIVASRGNTQSNPGNGPIYPAAYSKGRVLISVSGYNPYTGNLDPGSNSGHGVTLSAPMDIDMTTYPGDSYGSFGGTSCAAPLVSGVAALVLSKFKERGITNVYSEDVREILKISADRTGFTGSYDQELGFGRVQAGSAARLASAPFDFWHAQANLNRTVTSVSNGPDKLAFYSPLGLYAVAEMKRIRATFQVPSHYTDLSEVWVWGNKTTSGLPWENPTWNLNHATLVEKNGRSWTFETYTYLLFNLAGQGFWYPSHPSSTQIGVTVLAKQSPFEAWISRSNNSATVTAHVSGGSPPYSYVWHRKPKCSGGGGGGGGEPLPLQKDVSCSDWYGPFTSNPPNVWSPYNGAVQNVKLEVTDAVGKKTVAYSNAY